MEPWSVLLCRLAAGCDCGVRFLATLAAAVSSWLPDCLLRITPLASCSHRLLLLLPYPRPPEQQAELCASLSSSLLPMAGTAPPLSSVRLFLATGPLVLVLPTSSALPEAVD